MEKVVLNVEGMSCDHCVKAVTNSVGVLPGVFNVAVDLASKTVSVEYNPDKVTINNIKNEIEEQGFDIGA